ncbi:carbohydrate ABC transporter membrane protein 2, CUT1 family [Devosia sp. YR412]|uniref:carbohydrate ABC transporter permease n=1 Tax=Devosia sp. YR412 TaxID=1881030 RepID=UPI0008B60C38|nr:carbohydrate ABC transporter permease [Devosia sp. YR412]SEQ52608.1 carbohydrate ABC transporter membrane protein 2, CUT1 family [Devosia sp. YR412]
MSAISQKSAPMARAQRYLIGAVCVLVITLMLGPIALSFFASIKTPAEASASPPNYLPQSLSTENYQKVIDYQAGLFTYASNSFLVAGMAIVLCLVLAVPAGYGLARFRLPGKEVIFVLLLAPLMIPYQAILTPIYLNFSKIGLANSHLGLAIVHAVLQLPFSIYLMRNAFEAIPREIEEAALIDGATSLQVLRRIFLPLVIPGVVTVMLFTFINSWNEFLAALIFMNKESSFTVPIMLVSVRTGRLGAVDWGALQAGVIVSILPCILIYVLLQKYYVSGFLNGAVK